MRINLNFGRVTYSLAFLSLLNFYSISAFGSTCFKNDEAVKKLSLEYINEVDFSVYSSEKELDVVLVFPTVIDGLELSFVDIIKLSSYKGDGVNFIFPIRVQETDSGSRAWYMISEGVSEHNFVQAKYGDGCGRLIEYELGYKGQQLKVRTNRNNNKGDRPEGERGTDPN